MGYLLETHAHFHPAKLFISWKRVIRILDIFILYQLCIRGTLWFAMWTFVYFAQWCFRTMDFQCIWCFFFWEFHPRTKVKPLLLSLCANFVFFIVGSTRSLLSSIVHCIIPRGIFVRRQLMSTTIFVLQTLRKCFILSFQYCFICNSICHKIIFLFYSGHCRMNHFSYYFFIK